MIELNSVTCHNKYNWFSLSLFEVFVRPKYFLLDSHTVYSSSSGPLCSVLVNRFGCRPVMLVGGILASLGMILASFSTSIIHIYLSTGVITGLMLC